MMEKVSGKSDVKKGVSDEWQVIPSFDTFARSHGLYIPASGDIPMLVDSVVSGYGNSYPLIQWLDQGGDGSNLKERDIHVKGWRATWKANILSMLPESIILADSPGMNAWIMWTRPHARQYTDLQWLLNGGYRACLHMGIAEMVRFDAYERHSVSMRKQLAPDSFYLFNIVVRKECQGKGLGRRLLSLSHAFMDENGFPTYLETHSMDNVLFYQKSGYAVCSREPIPNTVIAHYAMMRKVPQKFGKLKKMS